MKASLVVGPDSGNNASLFLTRGDHFQAFHTKHSTIAKLGRGDLTVDDLAWQAGAITVGEADSGALTIQNDADVTSQDATLGKKADATGTAIIRGSGSTWTNNRYFVIGADGTGKLTIEAGRKTIQTSADVAGKVGSTGALTVTGQGSSWTGSGSLSIGGEGAGMLTISDGGHVSSSSGHLSAADADASGIATVTGPESTWSIRRSLEIGVFGAGTMTIENGASVSNTIGEIGYAPGATGDVTVRGTNSTWTNSQELVVAHSGTGTLTIVNGASVSNTSSRVGFQPGTSGSVDVAGADAKWINSGDVSVGLLGDGRLRVFDGGTVLSTGGSIGHGNGSIGSVALRDTDTTWINSSSLAIGAGGVFGSSVLLQPDQRLEVDHALTVEANATLFAGGGLRAGSAVVTSGGRLFVDDGLSTQAAQIAAGAQMLLSGATQQFGAGLTNHGDLVFGSESSVDGPVTNAAGAAITLLAHVTFNDLVNGPGDFFGEGTATFGGGFSPGASPAEVTFEAGAELKNSSTLLMEFGGLAPGTEHDHLDIGGQLILDGTLEVRLLNSFAPQAGHEFDVLDFGSLSGQFAQLHLPSLDGGLHWNTSNL